MKFNLDLTLEEAERIRNIIYEVGHATMMYDMDDGKRLSAIAEQLTKQVKKNGQSKEQGKDIKEEAQESPPTVSVVAE